ncbi:MAG: flagellar hook-length control protein FliK, partial [Candidatus Saganbacteria bacterium]|nr:flagellar hook-length control protein FliK [Candidatus Saganbacteria bacterium]
NLASEIIEKIKMMKAKGKLELEMTLNPEDLGRLRLKISIDRGIVSINFLANQDVREILESNLPQLKKALEEASINIGNLNVGVASDGSSAAAEPAKDIKLDNIFLKEKEIKADVPVYIDPGLIRFLNWIPRKYIYSEA